MKSRRTRSHFPSRSQIRSQRGAATFLAVAFLVILIGSTTFGIVFLLNSGVAASYSAKLRAAAEQGASFLASEAGQEDRNNNRATRVGKIVNELGEKLGIGNQNATTIRDQGNAPGIQKIILIENSQLSFFQLMASKASLSASARVQDFVTAPGQSSSSTAPIRPNALFLFTSHFRGERFYDPSKLPPGVSKNRADKVYVLASIRHDGEKRPRGFEGLPVVSVVLHDPTVEAGGEGALN